MQKGESKKKDRSKKEINKMERRTKERRMTERRKKAIRTEDAKWKELNIFAIPPNEHVCKTPYLSGYALVVLKDREGM